MFEKKMLLAHSQDLTGQSLSVMKVEHVAGIGQYFQFSSSLRQIALCSS